MRLIQLTEAEEFLEKTWECGFLSIGEEPKGSFVASKDWWAPIEDDVGMAPGNYMINQRPGIPPIIIRRWEFILDDRKSAEIFKKINKNIGNAFHHQLYFEADFERRGQDIVMIRKTRSWSPDSFNNNKRPLYHLSLSGTGIVEAVDSRTFDFLYLTMSDLCGDIKFFMQKCPDHKPIILFSKKSPGAIIMPIFEGEEKCDWTDAEGYSHIFKESDTYIH